MMFYPDDCLRFGINKGHSLEEVYHYNPSYLEFLIKYNQHFEIDLGDFRRLPKPLRLSAKLKYLSVERIMNMDTVDLKEFNYKFPDSIKRILELKTQGDYQAPKYIRRRDIEPENCGWD